MEVNLLITALESGDFHTALPLLENMTSDQLSQLTLPDKCTPLHYACRHGRVDVAQQLITHCKYSIESKDGKGRTPLHTAAQYGQVSTLKYLLHNLFMIEESSLSLRLTSDTTLSRSLSSILELKLSDRHRDGSGNTPLHTACVHGQLDIVQLLTREIGCDPNNTSNFTGEMYFKSLFQQHSNMAEDVWKEMMGDVNEEEDGHGMPPISLAAGGGHLDIIKYLIEEKGVEPHFNRKEKVGVPPVLTASCGGHLHVMKFLLEKHGCNISQGYREFILFLTCFVGHMDIVTYLITEADYDPHFTHESSCLETACWGGHLDVVKYLVDTHHCDPLKDNSLSLAALNGRLEIVSYIAAFAKNYSHSIITIESKNEALESVAFYGHLEVTKFFIEDMKCDPNCKGQYERTPLHHASARGHLNIVKYLLDTHHCDPLCPDENNETPLHLAAANSQLEVVSYFALTQDCNLLIRNGDNDTPLHSASLNGHLEVVRFFIEGMKCDPNCKGQYERTPLHRASQHGHLNIVKYLVDTHHCDPLRPDKDNETPLHLAAANGQLEVVSYFAITQDCNLLIKKRENDTPLHSASFHGHLEVVKFFIEDMKYDPNCKGQYESTPLHHASEGGHLDVVKYLVDIANCDPLCPDKFNKTPLHLAAANSQLEVVSYFANTQDCTLLIKHESNIRLLHDASSRGRLEVVRFLIEDMKCDPNCKDFYEKIPLHHASEGGHLDVVKYLVDTHHCDPLCPDHDEDKSTPFHLAASKGQLEVVSYFAITQDCNLLIRNWENDTPLHSASLDGHLEVVKFFIEDMKCDPNCKGQYGRTPLHHASESGHLDVVKYLVDTHHCDPLRPDDKHETPLHLAAANGELEVVSYFALTQDCNLLIRNWVNDTPLHSASLVGLLKVIKFFIEDMKCDPNCKGQYERTPLHHASARGHLDVVKYLVDTHHCNPLCPDKHRTTPLHLAVAGGELEIVQYFANIPDCDLQVKNSRKYSPLDIASQNDQYQVQSFLLRATTTKPVLQRDIISPSLNIFVIGNSGSGKSSLVKALSDEKSLLGRFITVKDVTPLTAGIVPTTINSRVFGSVNIYDFAGHEEYYVSHEILLQQTSHPLVLLTVDISLPLQTIEKQLQYWLSMLSNFQTSHVVVIGSHADLVRGSDTINQKIASLVSTESSIRYHGFIQCDCRYSKSSALNQLRRQLKSILRLIQVSLSHCESNDSNRLCASLMHILKYNFPEKAIISLSEVMKHITESGSEELLDESLLVQTCKLLSSNGHLLFMCHENNILEKSFLVLNKRVILQEVHACLRDIKAYLPNEFGIVEKNKLKEILSESLKNVMEPEQAIKYLIFTQFCTEIASDQLISPPDGEKIMTYYFFPNLALASRPGDLLPPGDLKYTHLYTWCLKCSHARQFFTPRYLHTLFIQLIKCERNVHEKLEYKIWNKGILIVHNNGTRSIIEVTDQTTRISLALQCVEGCESFLVKQRSLLISLIKSMAHKICPRVKVEEFFILPQNIFPPENSRQVQIARIAHSVIASLDTVSYNDGDILRHALVKDLLYFDSLLVIKGPILRTIFTQCQSNNVVPLVTVTRIHSAVETCRELQEWFEDETGQCRRDMTYSQLYRELIKYSIFTDGNLYVSCWSF